MTHEITISEYTNAILDLIKVCRRLKKDNDKSDAAKHLDYLFGQALRGYEMFGKMYASRAAQAEYEKMGNQGRITQWQMRQCKKFEKRGRLKGAFQFEHVYTIRMFQQAIRSLPESKINEDSIIQIVNANYAVAWITKDENCRLDKQYKFNRGESLPDAINIYKKLGIDLIDKDGNAVG
jgi:hypothetical protein